MTSEGAAPPTPSIAELLDRAATQPPAEALQTLEAAARLAQDRADADGTRATAALAMQLGEACYYRGELPSAAALWQHSLALYEAVDPGSLGVADALNNLGAVAHGRGDLLEARDRYGRALAIREQQAPGSLALAESLNNLGVVAHHEGDLERARALHERALTIEEREAPDSLDLAYSLNNLGLVAYAQGDLIRARELHERALAIREQRAPGSLDVAYSLNNLGVLAYHQRDPARAWEWHARALAIEEQHAPQSLTVATTLNNLGRVAQHEGDLLQARAFHERARAIREQQAPDSLDLAYSLHNLAVLAHAQGDLAPARALHERALAIREQRAPHSLAVAASLSLGTVLDETGAPREAGDCLQRALAIIDEKAPNALLAPATLRHLARLALEMEQTAGRPGAEGRQADSLTAAAYLRRAQAIEEAIPSLPHDPASSTGEGEASVRARICFLEPEQNAVVAGEDVEVAFGVLAPLPAARLRVWINGRPFGGEEGFDVAEPREGDKGGVIRDKGGVIRDKGGIIRDKGGIIRDKDLHLASAGARDVLARALPAEAAALLQRPQFARYEQFRRLLPVEDTDGEFLRIAIAAETTGGSLRDRHILRLRRPEAEAKRGALRVLAIGIGAYPHLDRLQFAAADAHDLAAALRTQAGDGLLYRDATVTVLADRDATRAAIRAALAAFTDAVQPGETLLLFLSGHGVKEGERFYFAPVELDPERIAATGLPWAEVLEGLQHARRTARAVWVLADCCRAAPGLGRERQATGRDLRRGIEDGGNLVICTAAAGDAPGYESEELRHGLFTQAWLEALHGEAPDILYEETARGRVLTLAGLQFLVAGSVKQHARRAGVRQEVEFPRLEGSFSPSQPIFVPV